jgi:hypothetical protein
MDSAHQAMIAALKSIREWADSVLKKIEESNKQQSLSWRCATCGHTKHFTRPAVAKAHRDVMEEKSRKLCVASNAQRKPEASGAERRDRRQARLPLQGTPSPINRPPRRVNSEQASNLEVSMHRNRLMMSVDFVHLPIRGLSRSISLGSSQLH